jgi:hypothetical protein
MIKDYSILPSLICSAGWRAVSFPNGTGGEQGREIVVVGALKPLKLFDASLRRG